MLVGRSGVRACPRPFCRSLASYPPKVYAYPFAVSPAEAIQQLSPVVGGRSTFQSLFNSGSQKPKQIVPVYFPAWFIDAEVEATVTVSTDRGTEDGRVTAVFTNSYIPGHTWDKLSSMSLLSPQLADSKAVPFSSDMETQHGSKITCLPFQTSPFSVLDAVKSLRPADCVHGNLRLDPLSISTNLISAYPVLIPLYLAKYQYKVKDDDNSVPVSQTAVMEAHHMTGRIIVENIQLIQQMAPPR
ncbi:hypothetical protein B0H17DRAFT_529872 [Mycena rosella]|uniref:Uncharacterized protein n=1 Tax=Mycena rosella TaxID=1033263 RepID=A0AAD7MAF3_MYCRO|nr:hypothetical protein B0H17DRAFT_529872 [Mycena rosella]